MNDAAANALLKTLEEPSPTSHIFLVTSRPDSLLQTIRSRCQTVRFAPVEADEIKAHLLGTKKFAPDDAELLARLARGSIGQALDLDLGKFREQRETMLKVIESLVLSPNRALLLKTAEEMNDVRNKDFYENYLNILQTLTHDIWTLSLHGDAPIVNADLKSRLVHLAQNAERKKLAAWLLEIETLRENFAVNLNKKIATDALFMQMAG
jgi:DNA polymerase III subunit delta'